MEFTKKTHPTSEVPGVSTNVSWQGTSERVPLIGLESGGLVRGTGCFQSQSKRELIKKKKKKLGWVTKGFRGTMSFHLRMCPSFKQMEAWFSNTEFGSFNCQRPPQAIEAPPVKPVMLVSVRGGPIFTNKNKNRIPRNNTWDMDKMKPLPVLEVVRSDRPEAVFVSFTLG